MSETHANVKTVFIVGFGLMSPNLSNITIIVVEDDNDVRRYVGAFLDRSGANVVSARNGREGLEAIKTTIRIWFCPTLKCRKWTASG